MMMANLGSNGVPSLPSAMISSSGVGGEPGSSGSLSALSVPAAQFIGRDHLERVREELTFLENHYSSSRREIDQLTTEKQELQRQYLACYEMAYQLTREVHKLHEVNYRLNSSASRIITMLPADVQPKLRRELELIESDVERAFRITNPSSHSSSSGTPSASHSHHHQTPSRLDVPHLPPHSQTAASNLAQFMRGKSAPKPGRPPKDRSTAKRKSEKLESETLSEERTDDEQQAEGEEDSSQRSKRPAIKDPPAALTDLAQLANAAVTKPGLHAAPQRISVPNLTPKPMFINNGVVLTDSGRDFKPISLTSPTRDHGTSPVAVVKEGEDDGLPRDARLAMQLPHGEVVCAVAVSNPFRYVFTGGKGCVKIWDTYHKDRPFVAELTCLNDQYIRSCKLSSDSNTLVVGGETNVIAVWDLTSLTSPHLKLELTISADAIYALAISNDGRHCFSCCSDGKINMWDLQSGTCVRTLSGHADGASCVDISTDGKKLLTGGLDCTVRVWEISSGKELAKYTFEAQIFALSACPAQSYLAVGLENSQIEVLNLLNTRPQYNFLLHESCVLSLKFAPSGKWFVSTGKDKLLLSWKSPLGGNIFQKSETTSILCCDISADSHFLVTGSGDKVANVYELIY